MCTNELVDGVFTEVGSITAVVVDGKLLDATTGLETKVFLF